MKTFKKVAISGFAAVSLAIAVAVPANANAEQQVSPQSVITTSKYIKFFSPGGLGQSFTDIHQNTNNVTIGWNGGYGTKSVEINKGSYHCATNLSTASSLSKVCTGVPVGTITILAIGNAGAYATFYDAWSN